MSREELIIYRIFDDYCRSTGVALDGALLDFLIKQHLNQNKDKDE